MVTIVLILAFLALTVLLATGSDWSNVLSAQRNEMVFASRNQAYGAYQLRRDQGRTLLIALFTGLGVVGGALLLPTLFQSPVLPPIGPTEVTVDVVIDPIVAPAAKPKITSSAAPRSSSTAPQRGNGIVVAVDSLPHTLVDTTEANPASAKIPGSGTPGGGPAPGGGTHLGTDLGTDVKNGWELETMPEYPGGPTALYAYLGREVRYPDIDIDARREGRVTVGFIIRSDGSVTDVKVLQGISPTLDAEAVRVVRKMVKWIPGRFNKREVDVRYALPIVFKLAKS